MTTLPVQRIIWKLTNAGDLVIEGIGRMSNSELLTHADVVWLNRHFAPSGLYFQLQEYDRGENEWITMEDPNDS